VRENEYVERTMKEQRIRLYIITGISESNVFMTQTRKEIGVSVSLWYSCGTTTHLTVAYRTLNGSN
jgi:hypothetical protein